MRLFLLPRILTLALILASAFAQTPTFTVVNTGLDATFGNAGKGVLDPQVAGFVGVAYGNGLFVAVAASTDENVVRWATSPDGTTWTARSQATPAGYTTYQTSKVHFLNGKFVFFTGFGDNFGGVRGTTWCYASTDGLTWTANKVTDSRINVEEFDASPTLMVAAAHNGAQFASTDLAAWTARPVVPDAAGFDHNDLAYGNGRFVSTINGFGGQSYTSTDGATWTPISSLAALGGLRVEFGHGVFLAGSGSDLWRSTDGVTFTKSTVTTPSPLQFPNTGSMRYAGGRFLCQTTDILAGGTVYIASVDGVTWTNFGGLLPKAPPPPAGSITRSYAFVDLAYGNGKYVLVGTDIYQSLLSKTTLPLIIAASAEAAGETPSGSGQPQSQAVAAGAAATLSTAATGTIQWLFNGANLSGATSATLTVSNVQPANAGIYTAAVTNGGTTTLQHAILGISSTAKVIGTGEELQPANISHPNGNIFDQVLLSGAAATITADPGQATRISYIDLTNDIVQVEFSGAGTLSIVLDNPSGPALPVNYNQAVNYMKGHATLIITGANETTNLGVFSVGRATAFDPTGVYNILQAPGATNVPANNGSSLFAGHSATVYDGMADLACIAIASTNGKFGGLRTANVSYFATKGPTGVYAPGVQFQGPVFVGDINASDNAIPVLLLGSASDTRITGGDLLQANGQAVQVSGLTQLKFTAGITSHGGDLPARTNKAVLRQDGTDVTSQVVVNP